MHGSKWPINSTRIVVLGLDLVEILPSTEVNSRQAANASGEGSAAASLCWYMCTAVAETYTLDSQHRVVIRITTNATLSL